MDLCATLIATRFYWDCIYGDTLYCWEDIYGDTLVTSNERRA